MTTFYLVRHAHATWTPDENRPLSERGQRDAPRVAELLCATAKAAPISAIYASPARRAQQTVVPLAQRLGLPLQIEPALAERRLAATPVQDFQAAVRATWDDFAFAHPGGETNAAAQARGLALVRRLANHVQAAEWHPDQQIVLGTHGQLLALIVQGLLPTYGYPFWRSLTMPDLYRLELPPSGDGARSPSLTRLWTADKP